MPHTQGYLREKFISSFEDEKTCEWWEQFEDIKEALGLLGKLWNCNDIVPSYTRGQVVDYIFLISKKYDISIDSSKLNKIEKCCTYAVLVRYFKPLLQQILKK